MNVRRLTFLALLCVTPALHSQEAARPAYCFDDLSRRSWCELEQIYRHAKPGSIPSGFARGHVVYCPSEFLAGCKTRLASHLWQGKHFCPADGTLVNQWAAGRAIRASVGVGPSWLDGQPAIILDYSSTSLLWRDVRDEMREVAPGLYLGAMYLRRCPCPHLKVFFVLQSCCCR